jgi:hypothetical protein
MTGGHPDTLSSRIPYKPRAKQLSEDYKQRKIEGNDERDTDTWVMWQGTEHESTEKDSKAQHHRIMSPSAVLSISPI